MSLGHRPDHPSGTPAHAHRPRSPVQGPTHEVRVKVYNASGVQGPAQTLTDKLKTRGTTCRRRPTSTRTRRARWSSASPASSVTARARRLRHRHGATIAAVPVRPARGRVGRRLHRRSSAPRSRGSARAPWPSRAALRPFVDDARALRAVRRLRRLARRPSSTTRRRRTVLPAARAALARLVPVARHASRW